MSGLIALVDCNNFYASCERLFDPTLRGKPVVVLSNNDGCAIARSNEAKALGIKMGDPWHLNRAAWRRQGVRVRSSNYTLYGDLSRRVMTVLGDFSPNVEVYSIDEAFLDLTGFEGREEAHARQLRSRVLAWTGIPVSVGIAKTKTLAKAANHHAKRNAACAGVFMIKSEEARLEILGRLQLTDIWGIGDRLAYRLKAMGIESPVALAEADAETIRKTFSVVLERTARELKGEPCQELELVNPPSKSICASRSFGAEQTAFVPVSEAVATFVARGSEKLRRQQLVAGTVSVFLETNTFKAVKQYHPWATVSLPVASADIRTLTTAAQNALRMIFKQGYRYKKAGVLLDDLSAAGCVQGDFWSEPDSPQSQALMRAMDRLNKVWGRGTVKTASCGTREAWRLRADLMSRRYTTRWDELLRVT